MAFLEVKNLYKNFGETEVLKGVSFEMNKGEVVSIIGSSGNGKTTLLRCLNSLETPDKGSISIEGTQIFPADKKEKNARLRFGMVFQAFNLFPQYTALENVTLALNVKAKTELKKEKLSFWARKHKMKEIKAKNAQLGMELLQRVGLETKANSYPYTLSGGQQQRVAIARALALSPDVLCFDEPTSALDPELTGEVLKVIKEVIDNERTIIIVTHEMNFAKNVSDKVIFMADGMIEEMGTPEQVFNQPQKEKTKSFLAKE